MSLFEPFRLGSLHLPNRLVMTSMSTRLAGPRGEVTDAFTEYYATRAAGGVGMVTVEEAAIHPLLPHIPRALAAYSDDHIPGLMGLVDRIHQGGAAASLQIGLYFRPASDYPQYVVSANAPDSGPDARELTVEEIAWLAGLYGRAAARARAAGFDAVEVHACHGGLIAQFLSPFWNRRTDVYGGEGRYRFALDVLEAVRKGVGPDYPVIFRISGSEFHEPGFTPEDAEAAGAALARGGVSAINVSGGLGHVNHVAIPPSDVPRGLLLPLAGRVRKASGVPVIACNSLTPELAAAALESGQADLIGLGRPLIVDPEWPKKVRSGRLGELRRCIRCNQGCFGGLRDLGTAGVTCMYNPQAGRETVRVLKPAATPLHVVVVGGGPAGCEAARVTRLRGHRVTLLEKADRLGGQFRLAAVPPTKEDFNWLPDFYANELPRLGVDVRYATTGTPELYDDLAADVVVLATGSVPSAPPIPGADLPHVCTAHAVLGGERDPEGPVVVIGGGATGLETADFLAERGRSVTVVEILCTAGRDLFPGIGVREGLFSRLRKNNVRILTGHRVMRIAEDAVIVSDRPLLGGGAESRIEARSVVLGLGGRSTESEASCALPGPGRVVRIGDALCPGNAQAAIHAAFDLAAQI